MCYARHHLQALLTIMGISAPPQVRLLQTVKAARHWSFLDTILGAKHGSFSVGVQQGQESPASCCNTASKMHQQASSQRADFIASSTPTSLSKAQGVSGIQHIRGIQKRAFISIGVSRPWYTLGFTKEACMVLHDSVFQPHHLIKCNEQCNHACTDSTHMHLALQFTFL